MLDDNSENAEFWSGVPEGHRRRRTRTAGQPAARRAHLMSRPAVRRTPGPATSVVVASRRHHDRAERSANQGMRRAFVLAATGLLLVPVAMALRVDAEAPKQVAPQPTTLATTPVTDAQAAVLDPTTAASVQLDAQLAAAPTDPATTHTVKVNVKVKPAPTTTVAKKAAAPWCVPYTVQSGDAWITIAHRANVSLTSLLTVNRARTSTSLFPGRSICLPAGATVPATMARPTVKTTTTTTTVKPSSKTSTKTSTKSTSAPTTTEPPLVAPANIYSRDEVMQIIRDVWPDDLEDHAIAIADRESHLNPSARNFCCYGLFQIYFSVHHAWLGSLGVTDASQLWDPKVNATVAYQMYLRNGFAPWGG